MVKRRQVYAARHFKDVSTKWKGAALLQIELETLALTLARAVTLTLALALIMALALTVALTLARNLTPILTLELHPSRRRPTNEWHPRLACHGARQHGLAGARRAGEEDAAWNPRAELLEALWVLDEFENLWGGGGGVGWGSGASQGAFSG